MAAGDLRGTVKTASGDGITARTLTWDGGGNAPQSGDMLFCYAVTGHGSGANTPIGWTKRLEFGFPDADDIATLFEREAGASETGVTVTIPGTNELNLIGFVVEGTLTYDDENITAAESDSSSIETGNVNISPAADTFFIGMGATSSGGVAGSMHSTDANSFSLAAQVQAANKLAIAATRKVTGASGNYSTRFSWSPYDAGYTNRGAIAAYAISTGGGASAIEATTSVAFASNATLTAKGELAASEAIAFGESATLFGIGPLQVSEQITFSEAAELIGVGSLSGAVSLVIAASVDLKAVAVLQAAATLNFGASATLGSGGALQASGSIDFSESADLGGVAQLLASESIAIAGLADLSGLTDGALAGSTSVSFSESALLSAVGSLAAIDTITFAESAVLVGLGELLGTTAITLLESVTLVDGTRLEGSTSITFAEAAQLAARGELESATVITFAGDAVLTNAGAITIGRKPGITSGSVTRSILSASKVRSITN